MSDGRPEQDPRPGDQPGPVRGLMLVLHGGRSISIEPTTATQLSVVRVAVLEWPVRRALRGSGVLVRRPRFRVRGWNGDLASPVTDLNRWLDEAADELGPVPIALIGHSMGARAALRAAGHPQVEAVAGLAPWIPAGEPVSQLTGTRVLLAHGDQDRITSPTLTWEYAERAGAVTTVTTVPVPGGDHAMVRHGRRWHQIAAEFSRTAFGLPPG
jgi:pimeloyl-ACP methyl ester carboxylesterase